MLEELKSASQAISKVVEGVNLTVDETEKAFNDIFTFDKEGYHYLAFCTALHTKGETSDELLGLCRTGKLGVKLKPKVKAGEITDLSGTGGGRIKTINVSTLASFIVTAAGFTVAKQAMFGITSPTGSADIFKEFGIDIFTLTKEKIEETLENVGICPVFLSAMSPILANRSKLARLIYGEKGLAIRSPFNVAAFAYSPTDLKRRIYGCYSEKYLMTLGELFQKLGNEKTLVVYGEGGLPEVSNFGKTFVLEQTRDELKKYELIPEDFGIKKAEVADILTGGREQNLIDFLKIIYGEENGSKKDLVLVNASAALFAMGKVVSFTDGVLLAREIIETGKASKVLEKLVEFVGDMKLLDGWKDKAEFSY